MAIDPKLFKKYTGRLPGEAMNRMGESLARQHPRGSVERASWGGGIVRWYRWQVIFGGLLAAAVVIYLLLTGGI